jgi:AAA domain
LYDDRIAFPIRDESGAVVAAHYRLKNGKWIREPTGFETRPIVIGELLPGDPVHLFESQSDAFAFIDLSGERTGIVITLAAGNGALVKGLIPKNSVVYAWKQNDELKKGKRAGDEWLKAACENTESTVKWAKIPAAHKDLDEWVKADATAEDLLSAMLKAEVVHEADKTWTDALSESVVTSRELGDLALTPRKKLLGDWFCEGDLGFIFAFRGVGKTWLALAIAQGLSTAGKLGEWQASERVRVLYVDGEMPPDLMRDRAQGLEKGNDEL